MRSDNKLRQPMVVLAVACLTAACTVGPSYKAPHENAPAVWITAEETFAPTAEVLSDWWSTFDDPLLTHLLERAVESNHDLRIAAARVREARALRRAARSQHLPRIGASADATRFRLSENGVGAGSAAAAQGLIEQEDDFFQAGFDASWEIDVFGGTRRALEGAAARVEAIEHDRRQTLLSILAEVARAYIELRGSERRLAVAEDNLRIQRESLERVESKVEAGLARRLDAQQARAQLEATRSAIPTFQAVRRTEAYRLAVLLGEAPGALASELANAAPVPVPPSAVALGLPSELLRRRPDVRAAERRLAAATADIGVAVADLYPRFVLSGAAGRESGALSDLFSAGSGTWLLRPAIQWSVFQGGRIRANIQAVEARSEAALARYERTVVLAIEEAEAALVRHARQQETRQSLEEAVGASRRAVELADVLYRRGLADYLTVLDVTCSP
ncbi:MAG: efflux transporter outer membrane subunit [Acidobacteriota bacterium]